MTKITEAQLRKVIRNELNEIFGFGKPKRLKTTSPHGDKLAALIASSHVISFAYERVMKAKKENNKIEEQKAFIQLGNAIDQHVDKLGITFEEFEEEAYSSGLF